MVLWLIFFLLLSIENSQRDALHFWNIFFIGFWFVSFFTEKHVKHANVQEKIMPFIRNK